MGISTLIGKRGGMRIKDFDYRSEINGTTPIVVVIQLLNPSEETRKLRNQITNLLK